MIHTKSLSQRKSVPFKINFTAFVMVVRDFSTDFLCSDPDLGHYQYFIRHCPDRVEQCLITPTVNGFGVWSSSTINLRLTLFPLISRDFSFDDGCMVLGNLQNSCKTYIFEYEILRAIGRLSYVLPDCALYASKKMNVSETDQKKILSLCWGSDSLDFKKARNLKKQSVSEWGTRLHSCRT